MGVAKQIVTGAREQVLKTYHAIGHALYRAAAPLRLMKKGHLALRAYGEHLKQTSAIKLTGFEMSIIGLGAMSINSSYSNLTGNVLMMTQDGAISTGFAVAGAMACSGLILTATTLATVRAIMRVPAIFKEARHEAEHYRHSPELAGRLIPFNKQFITRLAGYAGIGVGMSVVAQAVLNGGVDGVHLSHTGIELVSMLPAMMTESAQKIRWRETIAGDALRLLPIVAGFTALAQLGGEAQHLAQIVPLDWSAANTPMDAIRMGFQTLPWLSFTTSVICGTTIGALIAGQSLLASKAMLDKPGRFLGQAARLTGQFFSEDWRHAWRTMRLCAHIEGAAVSKVNSVAWRYDLAEAALKAKADPNFPIFGRSAVSRAAYTGDTTMLSLLLEHGAKLDTRDADGETPFLRAMAKPSRAAAIWLQRHGADIMAPDTENRTAADRAALILDTERGRKQARLLISLGLDPADEIWNGMSLEQAAAKAEQTAWYEHQVDQQAPRRCVIR